MVKTKIRLEFIKLIKKFYFVLAMSPDDEMLLLYLNGTYLPQQWLMLFGFQKLIFDLIHEDACTRCCGET